MLKLLLFTSHGLSISYKLQRKTFHVLSDLYHQQTITTYYSPIYDEINFFYRFFTTIHRNKKGEKYRNKELFDRKYPITSFYKKSFEIYARNFLLIIITYSRREQDSNLRTGFAGYTLSRRASSTTRAPLLIVCGCKGNHFIPEYQILFSHFHSYDDKFPIHPRHRPLQDG